MGTDGPASVSWDPLGYRTELSWRADFYPLGYQVRLETNSKEVLAAAGDCWAGCERRFQESPLRLRVIVSGGETTADDAGTRSSPPTPEYRASGHLLVLAADTQHFAACDLEAGFASCWVTASEVRRRKWFQRNYLEGCCYAMLTHRSVTPIHASCVAYQGVGALLCGRSGAGKSCLAYACAKSGLEFVSDASSYLVRGADDNRVMGIPKVIKLRPSAEKLFPELAKLQRTTDAQGESVVEVPIAETNGITSANTCIARCIVFLDRQDGSEPRLRSIEPHLAVGRLLEELPAFSERVAQSHLRSLEQLVRAGAFVLSYEDVHAGGERIRQLVEQGSHGRMPRQRDAGRNAGTAR